MKTKQTPTPWGVEREHTKIASHYKNQQVFYNKPRRLLIENRIILNEKILQVFVFNPFRVVPFSYYQPRALPGAIYIKPDGLIAAPQINTSLLFPVNISLLSTINTSLLAAITISN